MAGNGIANGALAALLAVQGAVLAVGPSRAQGTVPVPVQVQVPAPIRAASQAAPSGTVPAPAREPAPPSGPQ